MKNSNKKTILVAYFFSLIGDSLFQLAMPIFIYTITKDAFYTSMVYAIQKLPYVVIMPFMGGIIDKYSKKKLLLLTDICSAIVMFILAAYTFAVIKFEFSIMPIFPLLFILVALDTINHPAIHSFIPKLIPKEELSSINANMGVMSNVITVFGTVLGGGLIVWIGAANVFLINAVSFLVSFIFISKLPKDATNDTMLKNPLKDFKQSWKACFSYPITRYFAIFHFGSNICISLVSAGFVFYLSDLMQFNNYQIGLIIGFSNVGSMLGSMVAPLLMKKIKNGWLFQLAGLGIALSSLLFMLPNSFTTIFIAKFAMLFFSAIIIVLTFTIRQQKIPANDLGKTIVISRPMAFLSIPFASYISGYMLNYYQSMHQISIVACVSLLLFVSIGFFDKKFLHDANS